MPQLTASKRLIRLLLVSGLCTACIGKADEVINDAALKSAFESKLEALFAAGGVPRATDTLKQLREEKTAHFAMPVADLTVSGPVPGAYERARSATLVLGHLYLCSTCKKYHSKLSSGVVIGPDGLALTAFHVLDFKEAIVFGAMTASGDVFVIDEVIASSKKNDIALIRLRNAKNLPFVMLQQKVRTGDDLFVLSHPDGHFFTLTKGILSRKYLTVEQSPRLQITANFARGSSGAGIFNTKGELIGLASSTNSIYYEPHLTNPDNLQMVIQSGIPMSSAAALFTPAEP